MEIAAPTPLPPGEAVAPVKLGDNRADRWVDERRSKTVAFIGRMQSRRAAWWIYLPSQDTLMNVEIQAHSVQFCRNGRICIYTVACDKRSSTSSNISPSRLKRGGRVHVAEKGRGGCAVAVIKFLFRFYAICVPA